MGDEELHGDVGKRTDDEDPSGGTEHAIVKAAAQKESDGCSGKKRVCATDGVGCHDEVIDAVKEESKAQQRTEEQSGCTKDQEAAAGAQQEDGDGPNEIELLLDGERPEVRKRKEGGAAVVTNAWSEQIRVLEVEGEGYELVVKVEAEEEGGNGIERENAIVEGKDAKGTARVELAEEAGIGKRVVEDSCNEEAGEDEKEVHATGAEGEDLVAEGLEGGVRVGGEEVGAGDAEDSETADAVERRKMPRVGTSLGYDLALVGGVHLFRW
jgi:hypothetical protein